MGNTGGNTDGKPLINAPPPKIINNQTQRTLKSINGNYLTIEHINAQSLLCHLDEVKCLLKTRNIDILCITETWLESNIKDCLVTISDYAIFRCDLSSGGGVCVYVRDNLSAKLIKSDYSQIPGMEEIWLNIQYKYFPSLILGCVYRHPKASHNTYEELYTRLSTMSLCKKPVFLLGDLNDNQLVANNKLSKLYNQSM